MGYIRARLNYFLLIFLLAASVFATFYACRQFGGFDLSPLVDLQYRLSRGDRPGVDFVYTFPFAIALILKLFNGVLGVNWLALTLENAVVCVVCASLALYFWPHSVSRIKRVMSIVLIALPLIYTNHLWHSATSQFIAVLFLVLTLSYFEKNAQRNDRRTLAFLIAITAGLLFFCKQNVGPPLLLALGSVVFFKAWHNRQLIAETASYLAACAFGVVLACVGAVLILGTPFSKVVESMLSVHGRIHLTEMQINGLSLKPWYIVGGVVYMLAYILGSYYNKHTNKRGDVGFFALALGVNGAIGSTLYYSLVVDWLSMYALLFLANIGYLLFDEVQARLDGESARFLTFGMRITWFVVNLIILGFGLCVAEYIPYGLSALNHINADISAAMLDDLPYFLAALLYLLVYVCIRRYLGDRARASTLALVLTLDVHLFWLAFPWGASVNYEVIFVLFLVNFIYVAFRHNWAPRHLLTYRGAIAGAALLVSLLPIWTDFDVKYNDAPLFCIAVLFLCEERKSRSRMYFLAVALLFVAALCGGAIRARMQGVGVGYFWQTGQLTRIESGYFADLAVGKHMLDVRREIQQQLAQEPNQRVFFGPCIEFGYVDNHLSSPRGLPLWWHPGSSFDEAKTDLVEDAFKRDDFDVLIFVHGHRGLMPLELVDWINAHYQQDRPYRFIDVYHKRVLAHLPAVPANGQG